MERKSKRKVEGTEREKKKLVLSAALIRRVVSPLLAAAAGPLNSSVFTGVLVYLQPRDTSCCCQVTSRAAIKAPRSVARAEIDDPFRARSYLSFSLSSGRLNLLFFFSLVAVFSAAARHLTRKVLDLSHARVLDRSGDDTCTGCSELPVSRETREQTSSPKIRFQIYIHEPGSGPEKIRNGRQLSFLSNRK